LYYDTRRFAAWGGPPWPAGGQTQDRLAAAVLKAGMVAGCGAAGICLTEKIE